jgi:hypothetical protein
VAEGACGHQSQAVLLAYVVEFNCCCHCVVCLYLLALTGRNLINLI